jgi:truncated hemoglobin YjbI
MTVNDNANVENSEMIDKNGKVILPDFIELTRYAKQFSGLTDEKERLLKDIKKDIAPILEEITERFYSILQTIPEATPFLEGRIDNLKKTHLKWMHSLFTGPYDESYTETMYNVGDVHVKVNLPVEFMSGGITLISNELYKIVFEIYGGNAQKSLEVSEAVSSVMGFSLFVMQKSYHASVGEALDKFLLITGMSKALFDKLSSTFKTTN